MILYFRIGGHCIAACGTCQGGLSLGTFGLPSIRLEAGSFDESEYHLDGPGAIRHLEAVASIPAISVIQWQPGFKDMARDWTDLYRRIDELGKGAYLFTGPGQLRQLWRANRNRILCCELRVASRREADAALAEFGL